MKYFGLTETKLFHFHRIFKNGGWGGGSSEPHEPPLDPPLYKEQGHTAKSVTLRQTSWYQLILV